MENIFGSKRSYANKRRIGGYLISRTAIVIASLLFVSGLVVNQSVAAQNEPQIKVGENSRSITSGNQTRWYLLYIPRGYDGKANLPLVFLFHGGTQTSEMIMEMTDLSKVADKKKFIIAAPQGIFNDWHYFHYEAPGSENDDVQLVKDLIREIGSKVAIDKKRIYATGYSRGAKMSSFLACELPNVIAAIGPVAGLFCPDNCTPTRSVSVIAFHGTEDHILPFDEMEVSCWVGINGCNKTPMTRKISKDVTQITYGGCKDNAEVVFFRINDGGHTWPGSPVADKYAKSGFGKFTGKTNKDINASNLIWSFFEAHPLP
jgi:polyhydroxybutyrate depolymerase